MIAENINWFTKTVANKLPEGKFRQLLKWVYFTYIRKVVIGKTLQSSWCEDGKLHIRLDSGVELLSLPDIKDARLWDRYKQSQYTDKFVEYQLFRSTYDRIIQQFATNIYEKNCELLEGDIVVDGGASWGFNTIGFSRKVGESGKVVAIEPNAESLEILSRNVEINSCKNVTVVEKGLWNKRDVMKLYLEEHSTGDSLIQTWAEEQSRIVGTREVEVDTLDNILAVLEISRVSLLKLNIEGAEIEALEGAERIINENQIIEISLDAHHVVEGQPTYKTIIPMMVKKGFCSQLKKGGTLYLSKRKV